MSDAWFNLIWKREKKGPYDTKNSNKRMKYRFRACWTESTNFVVESIE